MTTTKQHIHILGCTTDLKAANKTEGGKMFDGEHDPNDNVVLSTTWVTAEGCFGAVTWNVCNELYTILPSDKRDELLEATGEGIIKPFFDNTVVKLLAHVGRGNIRPESLDSSWAMDSKNDFVNWSITCSFGTVTWQIGQGLWSHIPETQRDGLLEFKKISIHEFFELGVLAPLIRYAHRSLG